MTAQQLRLAVRAISLRFEGSKGGRANRAHMRRLGEAHQGWWQHENVLGVCIARARRGGKLGAPCVQVLVRRKFSPSKLAPKHRVPPTLESPMFQRPLRVDVRAVGEIQLHSLVTTQRPARPGFDVGSQLGESGTLGCIVIDAQGRRLGLSCAHVLAPDGPADVGDAFGGVVLCPSLPNAQSLGVLASAPIGTLTRVAAPSTDPCHSDSNVDAAVFAPNDPDSLSNLVADLGVAPTGINKKPALGDAVHKVGAVSGETHGVVQALGMLVKVPCGSGIATFSDQIGISSFASPGDSGALVLDEANRALGIHIGAAAGISICTPMERILTALDCKLA